ncbi:nucleotide exchange factor GrpE [Candidatus Poriferisocius sp.]|uniref:nucleotide exchange factor GrpE n=1 Tax=Candidatus Poriferisocius sp. TaxID=3101276 RepID=UPI003B5B5D78
MSGVPEVEVDSAASAEAHAEAHEPPQHAADPDTATVDHAAQGDPDATTADHEEEPVPSIEELLTQRDGYLSDLQRVTAEFANYRRKAAERQQETVAMAAAGIVEKVLPVLDAADAAVGQGAHDVAPIRDALFAALEKEGLARLDTPGALFDPNCHEAVVHEPGEGEAVIAEVLRAGYQWNNRVLRPAMVKVRG